MSKPLNVHLSSNDMDNMADNTITEPCGTKSLSSDDNDNSAFINYISTVKSNDDLSLCSFLGALV